MFTHQKIRKKIQIVQIEKLNMSSQSGSLMYKSGGDLFLLHVYFVNFVLADLCLHARSADLCLHARSADLCLHARSAVLCLHARSAVLCLHARSAGTS